MSNDISNNDMLTAINKRFDALDARLGAGGTGPGTWTSGPVSGPVNILTGEPGPGNQPYQVPVPVVRMQPIAEMSDMIASREKDWEKLGYRQVLTLKAWLNNLVNNWEKAGGVGPPEYVQDQLMGHALAYAAQWIDVGTGVDMKAIITDLVKQYAAWQKDQTK